MAHSLADWYLNVASSIIESRLDQGHHHPFLGLPCFTEAGSQNPIHLEGFCAFEKDVDTTSI